MIKHIPNPDQCVETGGHYWRAQVPGQPNICAECGYEGQIFEPSTTAPDLTEQQVRTRALELAVDWAKARGEVTKAHPGSISVTEVAESFAAFISEGKVDE